MPIKQCTLPGGGDGWKWGDHGTCYADRADAEKQASAAHANGYAGDAAIALDRATVRSVDADGRLHVALTNISKANVCLYYGSEIPDAQALGLKPDMAYRLLRDPKELAAAAPTFNNLPLLSKHVPVSADDHQPELVVGSTGTDARFEAPYLKNSLVVWAQDAIDAIESGEQRELSCAYRYRADMTPGQHQGQPYDGVMRDIRGNHVALVAMGRAGPDVVVGDSQPKEDKDMKVTAILAALKPFLAADADPEKVKEAVQKEAAARAEDEDDEDEGKEKTKKSKAEDKDDDADKDDKGEDEDDDEDDDEKDKADKKAMDAAIRAAADAATRSAVARMNAIRDAERAVRPIIGDLPVAQDSAEAVYKLALDHLKVDLAGVHPSAYPALLKLAQDKAATPAKAAMGMDGSAVASLAQRFPTAALLKR